MNEEQNTKQQYFKGLSRKEYIQKTNELIEKYGVDAVSIRSLAKELGCSSASLYRYFDSRDELVYYAGMRTLTGYIHSMNQIESTWKTIWDIYVGIWDCFAREAFRHPEIYNLLFFTFKTEKLAQSVNEYYKMFPEDIQNMNHFFHDMLKTSNFPDRDMVICRRCVSAGTITDENAVKLNRIACSLFKGYLKTILDEGIPEDKIEERVNLFIQDVDTIVFALAYNLKGYTGYKRKHQK